MVAPGAVRVEQQHNRESRAAAQRIVELHSRDRILSSACSRDARTPPTRTRHPRSGRIHDARTPPTAPPAMTGAELRQLQARRLAEARDAARLVAGELSSVCGHLAGGATSELATQEERTVGRRLVGGSGRSWSIYHRLAKRLWIMRSSSR